ncbi:TPA: hypothetical protein QEM49_001375 [Pseudomonas putida]|uniref:hypothetical protein n=1 Tax=Pseudomonas putida TaxID=303 RepID=UPI002364A483|nr:hypothetical protein [Pseudomonas putida]MDD2010306.1 hypothetical protein [Pseudomonas putida]HDS1776891.1 hypothetical protein [Pseudomonas putida]
MSTVYTVEISSSDGTTATLTLDISVLPGQSEWQADPGTFSIDNGPMLDNFKLMGLGVTPIAFLTGFPTAKDGKGGKNDDGGTFPQGAFDWVTTSKR